MWRYYRRFIDILAGSQLQTLYILRESKRYKISAMSKGLQHFKVIVWDEDQRSIRAFKGLQNDLEERLFCWPVIYAKRCQ